MLTPQNLAPINSAPIASLLPDSEKIERLQLACLWSEPSESILAAPSDEDEEEEEDDLEEEDIIIEDDEDEDDEDDDEDETEEDDDPDSLKKLMVAQ
jgi:hypothetical protein